MLKRLSSLPIWVWASITIDALLIALGVCLGRWLLPDKATELYSLIGAALGAIFAVGGAVLLWMIQLSVARGKTASVLTEICAEPIAILNEVVTDPGSMVVRTFAPMTEIAKAREAMTRCRESIRRFDSAWLSLSVDQIAILLRIERCMDRIEAELSYICAASYESAHLDRFKQKIATLTAERYAFQELAANISVK